AGAVAVKVRNLSSGGESTSSVQDDTPRAARVSASIHQLPPAGGGGVGGKETRGRRPPAPPRGGHSVAGAGLAVSWWPAPGRQWPGRSPVRRGDWARRRRRSCRA